MNTKPVWGIPICAVLVVGLFLLGRSFVRSDSAGTSDTDNLCFRPTPYHPTEPDALRHVKKSKLRNVSDRHGDGRSRNGKKFNLSFRIGHVFAGETNPVIAGTFADEVSSEPEPLSGVVQIFRKDGSVVAIRPPKHIAGNLKLIDVTDLNGDGLDEILIVNETPDCHAPAPGAFLIHNAAHLEKPLVCLESRKQVGSDGEMIFEEFNQSSVKLYQTRDGRRIVVVAPGTVKTTLDGELRFYRLLDDGSVREVKHVFPAPCSSPTCNDALIYPILAVDDLDGDGFKEVVVLSKAKIIVFAGEGPSPETVGKRLHTAQYVDPRAGETGYDVFRDLDGAQGVVGYRYGQMEIVPDLDGDGIKDLITAADALPDPESNGYGKKVPYPHMIVQAFKLPPPRGPHGGYVRPLGPLTAPGRSPSFTGIVVAGANRIFDSPPGRPPLGCTVDSIQDVTGDGLPEVIVSGMEPRTDADWNQSQPFSDVYTFDIRAGWTRLARFPGTCLGVGNFDSVTLPQPQPPDVIVWNPVARRIEIRRWDVRQGVFIQISDGVSAPAPPRLFEDSSGFTLSDDYGRYERHGADCTFHRLFVTEQDGKKQFVLGTKVSKLGGWLLTVLNTDGRRLNTVIESSFVPGRLQTIRPVGSQSSIPVYFTFVLAPGKAVVKVEAFVRRGNRLVRGSWAEITPAG